MFKVEIKRRCLARFRHLSFLVTQLILLVKDKERNIAKNYVLNNILIGLSVFVGIYIYMNDVDMYSAIIASTQPKDAYCSSGTHEQCGTTR